MKIILTAFNGMMESKPIDVPEETSHIFRLRLAQPTRSVCDFNGDVIASFPPFGTTCEFIRTGLHRPINGINKDYQSAAIYELNDIIKESHERK